MTARRTTVGLLVLGALVAGGATACVVDAAGGSGPGADATPTGSAPPGPAGAGASAVAAEQVPDASVPVVDHAALVEPLHRASPGDLGQPRLADGVVPPTNRWFSGLVLGPDPQPVFPLPVSFGLAPGGFALGAPVPVASAAAVVGPHVPDVTVDLGSGALEARLVDHDLATATLELLDADGVAQATVVLAQGSPFVSLTARRALTLTSDLPFEADEGVLTAHVRDTTWALVTGGEVAGGEAAGAEVVLADGESATWYPVPEDASDEARAVLAEAAADPVVGATMTYGVGEHAARTTLGLRTAGGGTSVMVALPHHRDWAAADAPTCDLGTYPSVHGTLTLCPGPLVTQVPALEASAMLDLSTVSAEDRAALVTRLEADVAAAPVYPSDTYFGGKALYRSAELVALGRELGVPEVVAPEAERLEVALREWTEVDGCAERPARCVVYDEPSRGVVGLEASFGSQEFNDHHFHYGYLLAAAGILAADDPGLAADLAPVMDALAQDVAAAQGSEWLPALRSFDVYRGHSWASGVSPFADGNNQESTSEAVSAWNGLALWARASGQADLETEARWLLSTEAAVARTYWTEPALDDPSFEGFEHQMFSLVWGAKRDHATWFSGEPSAILGIQLIPMAPVDGAMAADAERVRATVEEATSKGSAVQFGDYLAMYLALVDPAAAREAADEVPDTLLDGATSRSYLEAWLLAPPATAVGPTG